MTMRKKTVLIIGITIAGVMAVLYASSSIILLTGFNEIEDHDVYHNLQHSVNALGREITTLDSMTRHWASRDDTYAFVEDGNDAYIRSNLELDANFVNNNVNLMMFVNSTGQTVYAKGFDLIEKGTAPVTESAQSLLAPGSLLLQGADSENGVSGIILLPEGPMLIASEPILTSERTGPARGTLLWGRYLSQTEVDRLSQITSLFLTIQRLDSAWVDITPPPDFQSAYASITDDQPDFIQPLSEESIAGYTRLKDIHGNPVLMLRVEMPRPIYQQGLATMRYLLMSLLGVSAFFGIVTLLLLERLVLSRMSRLSTDVKGIGTSGDHSGRVHMAGKDELSGLAVVINKMLSALETSQHRLRQAHDELEERVGERTAELSTLYSLSRALADAAHDLGDILNLVTSHAVNTIHVTYARVALLEGDNLVVRAAYPVRPLGHDLVTGMQEPVAERPFIRHILNQDQPVILSCEQDDIPEGERQELFLGFTRTLCLVPLRTNRHNLGLLMLGEARGEGREPFTPEKISLAHSIGEQVSSALRRAELFLELERSSLQTVLALANAVDAKDTYTCDHGQRLAQIALAVGRELGMSQQQLEDLRYGAILHDVGKIGIPDAVLQKPAKLNAKEWVQMYKHPQIGARILASVPHLAGAAQIVLHHHERFDGSGYPEGLTAEAIPLGARILAVVDSFCAIVDRRVYKEARSREEAVAELIRCTGTQFDPHVVEVFLKLLKQGSISVETGGHRTAA